jgi:hypothetical protein
MKISAQGNNKLQLDFGNGVKLSTIWGYLTHSEHHDGQAYKAKEGDSEFIAKFKYPYESIDVEVMVSCYDEDWKKSIHKKYAEWSDGELLLDYLPIEQWLNLLEDCRKYVKPN